MVSGRRELRWGGVSPSTLGLDDLASKDSHPRSRKKQERGLRGSMAETLCDFLLSLHSRLGDSLTQE